MNPEFVVAKEAITLLKRDRSKYTRNVVGMYLLSTKGKELGSIFRSGYYFVRHIDDVLDGDRQISCDPLGYVQDLRSQVETGRFNNGSGIATLAKHAVNRLESHKKSGDDPRLDFLRAIDGIIFDYERSKEKRVLTAEQLEDYYFRAFDPVVNLTLMILNSSLRSRDIPAMSYGQGRVFSVRDLKDDWVRGTINVPEDILNEAALTTSSTADEVRSSTKVQKWFHSVLASTKPELIQLQQQLKTLQEPTTNFVLGGKISPVIKFIDRYESNPPYDKY